MARRLLEGIAFGHTGHGEICLGVLESIRSQEDCISAIVHTGDRSAYLIDWCFESEAHIPFRRPRSFGSIKDRHAVARACYFVSPFVSWMDVGACKIWICASIHCSSRENELTHTTVAIPLDRKLRLMLSSRSINRVALCCIC